MHKIFTKISFPEFKNWSSKGCYSVIDQGLFSGTNFILNIFLARWLLPERYGIFALSFSIYLFFSGFHNAFILEPMTIFGPAKYQYHLSSYLASNLRLHFIITSFLGSVMAFTGAVVMIEGTYELGSAILTAGISLPFMLLIWLSRRSFYIVNKPSGAVIGSLIYLAIVVSGAFAIRKFGWESQVGIWYLLLALSSLVGGGISWLSLRLLSGYKDGNFLPFKNVALENWCYGKWIMPASIFFYIGNQVQIYITAILLGLETAGAWRALQNFTLPLHQILTAIATLGLPLLAKEVGKGNLNLLRAKGITLTIMLSLLAGAYAIMLFLFAAPLELLMYEGKFSNYVWLVPFLGILPILTAFESGLGLMLRALQKNLYYLMSMGVAAITGLGLSVVFIKLWGLFGAVQGALFTNVITLLVTLWLFRKWFPKTKETDNTIGK